MASLHQLGLLLALTTAPVEELAKPPLTGPERKERLAELVEKLDRLVESPRKRRELFEAADAEGFGLEELIQAARADGDRVSADASLQGLALHSLLMRSGESREAAQFLMLRMLVPHVRERLHQLLTSPDHLARPEITVRLLLGDIPRRNTELWLRLLADPGQDADTHWHAMGGLSREAYWFDDATVDALFDLLENTNTTGHARRAAVLAIAASGRKQRPEDFDRLIGAVIEGDDIPVAEALRVLPEPLPDARRKELVEHLRRLAGDEDQENETRIAALERLSLEIPTEEHWLLVVELMGVGADDEFTWAVIERIALGAEERRGFHPRLARAATAPDDDEVHRMGRSYQSQQAEAWKETREGYSWLRFPSITKPFPPAWKSEDCLPRAVLLTDALHSVVARRLRDVEIRTRRKAMADSPRRFEDQVAWAMAWPRLAGMTLEEELRSIQILGSRERPLDAPDPCHSILTDGPAN
ncbi:MAG: hypothetical protein AAF533_04975 [Acidobacteriota bacterium]